MWKGQQINNKNLTPVKIPHYLNVNLKAIWLSFPDLSCEVSILVWRRSLFLEVQEDME